MTLEMGFVQSLHEDMSPPQMLLLRTLNLTVLRSQWIGDIFRKLVVRRLISGRRSLGLSLSRRIAWPDEGITIQDRITGSDKILPVGARLFRCRRITGTHMASARYFTLSELSGDSALEEVALDAALRGLSRVIPARASTP